jgi:hypothetical protein
MIYGVLGYFLDWLPMYKMSVDNLEMKKMQGLPTRKRLVALKVAFIVETIVFTAACLVFLLKCFGALPWW